MAEHDLSALVGAIDSLADAGFVMGPEWSRAHEICQAHEGEPLFDWGHALCHRVEGDIRNAGYWYASAGKPAASGGFSAEWAAMRPALMAQT